MAGDEQQAQHVIAHVIVNLSVEIRRRPLVQRLHLGDDLAFLAFM
jgi:hypothetical protein